VAQLTMPDNEVAPALFEDFQETPEERPQTTAFTRLSNRRICGSRRCFSSGVQTTSLLIKFSVIESCMPVRRCWQHTAVETALDIANAFRGSTPAVDLLL
jgi:hypothetical protein